MEEFTAVFLKKMLCKLRPLELHKNKNTVLSSLFWFALHNPNATFYTCYINASDIDVLERLGFTVKQRGNGPRVGLILTDISWE